MANRFKSGGGERKEIRGRRRTFTVYQDRSVHYQNKQQIKQKGMFSLEIKNAFRKRLAESILALANKEEMRLIG